MRPCGPYAHWRSVVRDVCRRAACATNLVNQDHTAGDAALEWCRQQFASITVEAALALPPDDAPAGAAGAVEALDAAVVVREHVRAHTHTYVVVICINVRAVYSVNRMPAGPTRRRTNWGRRSRRTLQEGAREVCLHVAFCLSVDL